MSLQNAIIYFLDKARLLHLATSNGDEPWSATVYFAHDNAHNLYWVSAPTTRHSQEISRNAKVAGTIVLGDGTGKQMPGLQVSGIATEVPAEEIQQHIEAYAERFQRYTLGKEIASGRSPLRLYKIKPNMFILYDQVNFPNQPKQVWNITEV